MLKIGRGRAAKGKDLIGLVDEDAGWGVGLGKRLVEFTLHVMGIEGLHGLGRPETWTFRGPKSDAGTQRQGQSGGYRAPQEDVMFPIEDLEKVGAAPDRLGATDEKHAPRAERVVKYRDDPLLKDGVKVDEHVAAAQKVDVRERRIAREIVLGERAHLPDGVVDAVPALHLAEEPAEALGGNLGRDRRRVEAGACLIDIFLVDVGAEDLDG